MNLNSYNIVEDCYWTVWQLKVHGRILRVYDYGNQCKRSYIPPLTRKPVHQK